MDGKKGGKDSKVCTVCNVRVKRSNYANHMRRVHGVTIGESPEPKTETVQKGRRAERRKIELARRKRNRNFAVLASALFFLAIGIGFYLTSNESSVAGPEPVQPPPPQTQSTVKISLYQLGNNSQFYTYDSSGVSIRYFAVVGSDGSVHVALDACDVCYAQKRGYRQVGEVMKCNNCGKEFAVNSIGTENLTGGCWPSHLPVSLEGNDVVVQISNLTGKRYMFQ